MASPSFRADDLIFHHDETRPAGVFARSGRQCIRPRQRRRLRAMARWRQSGNGAFQRRGVAGPERVRDDDAASRDQRAADARSDARDPPRDHARIGDARPGGFGTGRGRGALRGARGRSGMGEIPAPGARPNYAALIDQDKSARENRCLAEAIYFEARGESEEGQAAVAQVVLNRVSSGLYPATICGVVYQNRWHYNACQFSFACDGQIPAHRRTRCLAAGGPHRRRSDERQDLCVRYRQLDPFSCQLCPAALGKKT